MKYRVIKNNIDKDKGYEMMKAHLVKKDVKKVNIMLVVFSVINLENVVERSFKLTNREGGKLHVTIIQEEKIPSALSSLLMDSGFLGEKVKDDVKETIKEEYKRRTGKILTKIKHKAKRHKINLVGTESVKKASLIDCYDLIDENNIDYLILNYTNNRFVSRTIYEYIHENFIEDLNIPCELFMDGQKKRIDFLGG